MGLQPQDRVNRDEGLTRIVNGNDIPWTGVSHGTRMNKPRRLNMKRQNFSVKL
jgi:hypothetical protein